MLEDDNIGFLTFIFNSTEVVKMLNYFSIQFWSLVGGPVFPEVSGDPLDDVLAAPGHEVVVVVGPGQGERGVEPRDLVIELALAGVVTVARDTGAIRMDPDSFDRIGLSLRCEINSTGVL